MPATVVTRNGCTIVVEVRAQFHNLTTLSSLLFAAYITNWRNFARKRWNRAGAGRYGHCKVKVKLDWIPGQNTPNYHQINVVNQWDAEESQSLTSPAFSFGQWRIHDSLAVIAHEAGHLLGLLDEYSNAGALGSYMNENVKPAAWPPSLMAQTWNQPSVYPEHLCKAFDIQRKVFGNHDADCPPKCGSFWYTWVGPMSVKPQPFVPPPPMPVPEQFPEIEREILSGIPHRLAAGVQGLVLLIQVPPGDLTPVLRALRHSSPLMRWAGAKAIGVARATAALSALQYVIGKQQALPPNLAAGPPEANHVVRVRVAASLLQLGSRDGMGELIAALDSEEVMFGHPPELVASFANKVLKTATGEVRIPFDENDPSSRASAILAWTQWWNNHPQFNIVVS